MLTDRPPRICAQPGCGALTIKRYCGAHANVNVERLNHPWAHMYRSVAWFRTRVVILNRDPVCRDPYDTGCHEPSTRVDHVKDHGGNSALFFDLNNLQGLCVSCHNRKTALTVAKGA